MYPKYICKAFHVHVNVPTHVYGMLSYNAFTVVLSKIIKSFSFCKIHFSKYSVLNSTNFFFCTLQYVSLSKRFVPECMNFLHGLLFLASNKDSNKCKYTHHSQTCWNYYCFEGSTSVDTNAHTSYNMYYSYCLEYC